jgi:hypothetical protein
MKKAFGLVPRLAVVLSLAMGIVYLETARSVPAFRFWTFLLFALALAILASFLRGGWRDRALGVVSLVFGLCAIEGIASFLQPAPIVHAEAVEVEASHTVASLFLKPIFGARKLHDFVVASASLGWRPGHAGQFHVTKIDPKSRRTIYDVTYAIDGDLLRATRSCATGPTIGFFGDSFTFGEGLNDADTLPQQVADSFGGHLHVLNFGFSGYGPQQFLREMQLGLFDRQIGPHPELFVYLTAPWHAQRTSCKASWVLNGPRYALVDGRVVYQGRCLTGVASGLRQWFEHSAAYRMFIEHNFERITHADIELYSRILIAATKLAKTKYRVPVLIAYIPTPSYLKATGFTDDAIIADLRAGGAQVLDVSLPKTSEKPLAISGDGHPTAYANQLRASMLRDYIVRHFAPALSLSENGQPPACRAVP